MQGHLLEISFMVVCFAAFLAIPRLKNKFKASKKA